MATKSSKGAAAGTKRTSAAVKTKKPQSGQTAGAAKQTQKKRAASSAVKGENAKSSGKRRQIDVPDIRRAPGTPVYAEAILWIVLALCIILFISNVFGIGGTFRAVSRFFFGVFGILGYVVPILLFVGTAFLVANRASANACIKTAAAFFLFVCLCAFCELLSNQYDSARTFMDYYTTGSELSAGGGVAGGLFCRLFCSVFGQIGAWICLLVLVVISVIIITERSLFDDIRGKSKRAYRRARADSQAKKELNNLRREKNQLEKRQRVQSEIEKLKNDTESLQLEARVPRRERRVTGVIRDTKFDRTLPSAQEIHEVVPRRTQKNAPQPEEAAPAETKSAAKAMVDSADPQKTKQMDLNFTIERDGDTQKIAEPAFAKNERERGEAPLPAFTAAETELKEDAGIPQMPDTTPPKREEPDPAPAQETASNKPIRNPRSSREEQEKAVDSVAEEIALSQKEEKPE